MIRRIYSDLKTFKELRFTAGLNVLFADKTVDSTLKHTRNRAGKSSTIEIIHFIMAADCSDESIFRAPELIEHRFGMEFDLGGRVVTVERSGKSPNEFIIVDGNTSGWPVQPNISQESGERILTLKEWAYVLGALIFKLDEFQGKERPPYAPTFRSLFPYFVRRLPGGFIEPHLHLVQAKPASWQVAVSYLLGLDWTIPQEWQVVRDEEEAIKKLKAVAGEGDLADIVGKKPQLRTEIATAESLLLRFRERLDRFQVLPDFREYERRASALTQRLSDLSSANTLDQELLAELRRAVEEEKPPETADLGRAYREAGIVLAEMTLRRFDEVRRFHESVIANRRTYLAAETQSAQRRIETRENEQKAIDTERQQIMGILKSHGALEQFSNLQQEYGRKMADLELLRKRFAAAEKIEEGLARLRIRRQELLLRLEQDYSEQSALLKRAIVTFEDVSSELYQKPARFMPTETTNGPLFNIEVQGERSPGIKNMQIFCFDMTLTLLVSERGIGPGFLVHDSHLFDPVDGRQVGSALKLSANLAEQKHFQYIVTLNSDKQIEAPVDFEISKYVMPVKLTDTSETGGLFGIRFG
jgi:uncharacterized protein YydD (DUF2326 family)